MRVRIVRARHGEIDGVDLSQFAVGIVYDLSSTLAGYLMLTNSAEADDPVAESREVLMYGGGPLRPDVADDAGVDEGFIEVFERVCDTSPIVVTHERGLDKEGSTTDERADQSPDTLRVPLLRNRRIFGKR